MSERGDPRVRGAIVAIGLSAVMMLAGLASVAAVLAQGAWWWEPDAEVPRDGASHAVRLTHSGSTHAIWSDQSLGDPTCTVADSDGTAVAVSAVPRSERVTLEEPWVAVPEASRVFTSPADGHVTVTCDAVDATPTQVVELAPLRPRVFYDVVQYGPPLLAPAGLVVLLVAVGALLRGVDRTTDSRRG